MASLDTLNITDSGLLNINKKIVNSRVYANDLITTVGNISINDGIATGFSSENYLTYSPLHLQNSEKVEVSFYGTFTQGNARQCAWELTPSEGEPLSLIFENTQITLSYGNYSLCTFGNLEILNDQKISAFLVLTNSTIEITISQGSRILQRSGSSGIQISILIIQRIKSSIVTNIL